ncbi:MAG: phage baseplate assembly protein V [Acidimicrobiia bacterium]
MTVLGPSVTGVGRHAGKLYGKYPGVVAEIDRPEGLGWIDVTMPTLFPGQDPVTARPCFPPGHFWVPPIGAHVWVEFEAGEPSSPIWVGTWEPEGTVVEEARKSPPTSRVIHTPSGHVVEFSDKEGEERIVVRHKQNAFVAIDEDGSVVLSSKTGGLLFLNADADEASIVSPQGHSISLTESKISLVHAGGATIEIADGKVQIVADDIDVVAKGLSVPGGASMGGPAPSCLPVALGPPLLAWLASHTHGSAMGPTTPPVVPPPPAIMSTKVTAGP